MAKRTRDALIQRNQQAQGALDRALYHLSMMKETYGDNYPEHTQTIDMIAQSILLIRDALQSFRTDLM